MSRRDNPKTEQILAKFDTGREDDIVCVIKKDDPENANGNMLQPLTLNELDKWLQKQPAGKRFCLEIPSFLSEFRSLVLTCVILILLMFYARLCVGAYVVQRFIASGQHASATRAVWRAEAPPQAWNITNQVRRYCFGLFVCLN